MRSKQRSREQGHLCSQTDTPLLENVCTGVGFTSCNSLHNSVMGYVNVTVETSVYSDNVNNLASTSLVMIRPFVYEC